MEVKDIIRNKRIELHLTMKQVADKVGVSEGTISRWESGEISNMRRDRIAALAKALLLPPEIIMEWDLPANKPVASTSVSIPVYGTVSAGNGCFAEGNIEEYIDIPESMAKHGDFFGLRVKGDSMEPDIKDGDIVIVKKQDEIPGDGKTVVAIVNGDEGFCKRLARYAEGIGLVSNNPNYMPKFYSAKEIKSLPVRIIGVVERLIRDF